MKLTSAFDKAEFDRPIQKPEYSLYFFYFILKFYIDSTQQKVGRNVEQIFFLPKCQYNKKEIAF